MDFSSMVVNNFKDTRTGDTNVKEFSEILRRRSQTESLQNR